ncbi:MAG: hypothetical protein IJ398_06405 [Clostridia bacterium]|nr:hypothetical protein [Clostridia bacterium]
MKKILYLALCLALVLMAFAACGETQEPHTHTYADKYSSNAMGHWYAPTCGCKDTAKDASEHVDETNDGICDVCGYSDADHEHTYAEEYTYDENGHWNVANCGHDLTTEAEKHTLNKAGFCVCGYFVAPKIETLAQALEIAELQGVLVKTGTSILDIYDEINYAHSYTDVFYEFTDDYFHAFYSNDPREDVYVGVKENGDVFAVVIPRDGNSVYVDEEAFEDYLNGAKFNNNFMGDYSVTAYGVVDYINAMYEFAKENKVNTFEEKVDGNKFSFTFDQYTGWYYNIVTVEFTLDETGYYIDEVVISNTRYAEEVEYYDYNIWDYATMTNFTVTRNDETDDVESIELVDGAITSFTTSMVINQYTEAKENPYNPSDVLVESFKVVDKDGKEFADTIKINAGDGEENSVFFFFKDVLPTTAILELIEPTIVAKNDKGEVVEWKVYSYYNPEDQSLQVYSYAAGTYTIEITVGDAIVTKTLVVELKDPTSFGAGVVVDGMTEEKTNVNMFAGNSIDIESVVGSYEKGDYTAAITSDNAANATLTLNDGIYTFTTTTVGTYEITLTSSVVSTLTATLTVEVKEVPAIEDILTGYYEASFYGTKMYSLTFGENNTVVVAGQSGYGVYTYAYDETTKAVTFTYVSDATLDELNIVSLELNSNYELVATNMYGNNFVFVATEPPAPPITAAGEYDVKASWAGTEVRFQFDKAGTLTVTPTTAGVTVTASTWEPPTASYNGPVTAGEMVTLLFIAEEDVDAKITVEFVEASEETTTNSGTLTVVDDMKTNGDITGSYTYTINGDGSYSIYLNDEPCETFEILPNPGGFYCARVPASMMPMSLVDENGSEVNALNGTYYIKDGETTYYTFTFTPSTGDSSEGGSGTGSTSTNILASTDYSQAPYITAAGNYNVVLDAEGYAYIAVSFGDFEGEFANGAIVTLATTSSDVSLCTVTVNMMGAQDGMSQPTSVNNTIDNFNYTIYFKIANTGAAQATVEFSISLEAITAE